MKVRLAPSFCVGEDGVSHALISIIATTRRHWRLPPEATIGVGIRHAAPARKGSHESISSWPYPTATSAGKRRHRGDMHKADAGAR
jgi:hypothetical protein